MRHIAPQAVSEGSTCSASWFTGSQGKYGPLFGMYAAHWTWGEDGGSRQVRVTAIRTGRSVVVTIRDRGPAPWTHRCIDLSRSAFGAIAPLSAGVVSVRIERL